jgi:hypothetical protein
MNQDFLLLLYFQWLTFIDHAYGSAGQVLHFVQYKYDYPKLNSSSLVLRDLKFPILGQWKLIYFFINKFINSEFTFDYDMTGTFRDLSSLLFIIIQSFNIM